MAEKKQEYSELIGNFERIREYMREFYVYGFKSRNDIDHKSARSYDNERRRIESYLWDYMNFRQTAEGKTLFLSIDSRRTSKNPLYQAWKAKSFTPREITLHFVLMDVLPEKPPFLTMGEIMNQISSRYKENVDWPFELDESTVRKRLKQYVEWGMVEQKKEGRQSWYGRTTSPDIADWEDAVTFFSEAGQLGVVGSYVLDWLGESPETFSFKHHDITRSLESDMLAQILEGIGQRRELTLHDLNRNTRKAHECQVVPLKIFVSTQSGRNYLLGWDKKSKNIQSWRIDFVTKVQLGEPVVDFYEWQAQLAQMQKHMWGISCRATAKRPLEHVEFTVHAGPAEGYIPERLEREKRCGQVTRIDDWTYRFTADVYDTMEMLPWLRTWICRIESMKLDNKRVEEQFKQDLEAMYALYDMEPEGGEDA